MTVISGRRVKKKLKTNCAAMRHKAVLKRYRVGCVVQVVGADDIKEFFARMEERKKERLAGLQYHCK